MQHFDILKETSPVKHIEKDILNNKLSNSYIISSEDEQSLKSIFKIITMKLMCKKGGCNSCDVCKMIQNDNMADVYIIDKPKISTEDINDLIYDTMLKSVYHGYKVYIILGADRMMLIPQNKLLKIIEEPPQNCIYLLGVGNDAQIIPTLKSRCIKLVLEEIDKDVIRNEMIKLYGDKEKAEIATDSCQGLLSNADRIMNDNAFIDSFKEVLNTLISIKKSSDIVTYLNNPIFLKENISATFNIIEMIFRDIMVIVSDEIALINNKHFIDDLMELSQGFSKESATLTLQCVYKAKEQLTFNCNATSVADSFLIKMLEVKYLCRI